MEKLWCKIIKYNPNFHKFNLKPNKNIIIVRKVFVSLHGFVLTWVFCGSWIVRRILLPLSHQGSPFISLKMLVAQWCLTVIPWTIHSLSGSSVHGTLQARILQWVAIPFSRGSSWLRDQPRVYCITGRFFTIWAIGEAHTCIHTYTHTCMHTIHTSLNT